MTTLSSPLFPSLAAPSPGFGLGLRTQHYPDFLAAKQPLDWLEVITDNFLVEGGKPLVMLDTIRRDYPVVMHGVAMSIGSSSGIDPAYVRRVKALADRVQPLWVSDHLCWVGPGPEILFDIYPLPYTDEAARHMISQISHVQDILGRRLVLENVSSYIDYRHSASSEWQFLSHIADEADCLLLVDVNNIYVSSVNHNFNPLDYLKGLPGHRVQQFHLAGHSNQGTYIIDTHDQPIVQPVWELYAQACRLFGNVATMIERDDHIPPLPELLAELAVARQIATDNPADPSMAARSVVTSGAGDPTPQSTDLPTDPGLKKLQRMVSNYVLDLASVQDMTPHVQGRPGVDVAQRLHVYHHAYRARLTEVLADVFAKTYLYMGSRLFDEHATNYVVANPPRVRSLNLFGGNFAAYLQQQYPNNAELFELARMDWDMRSCLTAADVPAMDAATAAGDTEQCWLTRGAVLHPTLSLNSITSNVVQIWKAIDNDAEVPEVTYLTEPSTIVVWRKELQPHFKTVDGSRASFLHGLAQGQSIAETAEQLAGTPQLSDPAVLGQWLREWWEDGLLQK